MTKEQEEAIKYLRNYKYTNEVKEAIDIVLSMLEEKDKVIDLLAETINNQDIDEDICKQMGQKENCNKFEEKSVCIECIKQYFENKAKEK